jgi:hypothetical protein
MAYRCRFLALSAMASVSDFLRAPWPARWRLALVLVLYGAYLPFSGYTPGQVRFDAGQYWELSLKFTQHGSFSLLAFDEPLRGYLGPLLLLPARLLCHFTGCSILAAAQVLGAGWAALLFGLAVPQLWEQVTRRALSGSRWLVLVGLGFVFWRDYFNFPLSDMPALTLLLLGMVALGQSRWGCAGVAGVLLAAAINIRPIYLASAPGWLWLLVAMPTGLVARQRFARSAALVVGMALVLLPQLLINIQHFQQPTPLVLAQQPGGASLYLKQLGWGTAFQRYETSLIPEIPRSLVYADSVGQRALTQEPGQRFRSYEQYLGFVARQPLATCGRYLRHLFNGLDIRFPTPYPTRLHPLGQALLRVANYTLLGLALWVGLAAFMRNFQVNSVRQTRSPQAGAVLLALLLPCLLVLPTLIECRFLLPLHLLLLTTVAAAWQPLQEWRVIGKPVGRAVVLVLTVGWVWSCWQLSEAAAGQLRPPSEAPQN